MEDKAIRGVPWTLLTVSSTRVINLAATVVLARLLVPADFGVVALATLSVELLAISRDFGLGNALIFRQDLDERAKGTVLALVLISGAVLAAVIAALSPVMATLLREPRLTEVLAVFSVVVLISGPSGFYDALMLRELEMRRRFIAYLIQSMGYASVAVILAGFGAGVWSLVVGQIAGALLFTISLVAMAPYRVPVTFDARMAREAFSKGRGFVVQSALVMIHRNLDYVVVGRSLGTAQLGYYSMAYRLGELPSLGVAEPVSRVTFPGFSRMRSRGESVVPVYLTVLGVVALIASPFGVVLSASADPFTRFVFGDQWIPMIGVLSILGVWAILRPIWVTVVWLLNSVGAAEVVATVFACLLLPLVGALVAAVTFGGATTVARVLVGDISITLAVFVAFAARRARVGVRDQWHVLRPVVIASAVSWGAGRLVAEALSESSAPSMAFFASASACALSYLSTVYVLNPALLRGLPRQVRRTLGREEAVSPTA